MAITQGKCDQENDFGRILGKVEKRFCKRENTWFWQKLHGFEERKDDYNGVQCKIPKAFEFS